MPRFNQNIKRGLTKTLLIILGIIVAALMSFNSSLFTSENLSSKKNATEVELDVIRADNSSSGINYNSGIRILHVFTENLPYLNNK